VPRIIIGGGIARMNVCHLSFWQCHYRVFHREPNFTHVDYGDGDQAQISVLAEVGVYDNMWVGVDLQSYL
jgi:hypothetical protein